MPTSSIARWTNLPPAYSSSGRRPASPLRAPAATLLASPQKRPRREAKSSGGQRDTPASLGGFHPAAGPSRVVVGDNLAHNGEDIGVEIADERSVVRVGGQAGIVE